MVITTTQLHSTKPERRLGTGPYPALLAACRRFAMVRISDNGLSWNKAKYLSSINHTTKTIHYLHHHQE